MIKTVRIKESEVYKDWHVIDAAGRPLGRVATEAATLLKGKHKPTYEPHLDDGDFVIVVNAGQVRVTGNKEQQITYYRHSGYPGGLKSRTYAEQFEKFPERVLEKAIWGMLPKGSLGKKIFRHLKVYKGATHPHQSQIANTEKQQELRKAALSELIGTAPKLNKLRPLSIPQVLEVEEKPAPKARTVTPAAAAAREARARVRKPARQAEAEAPATAVVEAPADETAPPAEAPKRAAASAKRAEAPVAEVPKRAPRRKASEPAVAATAKAPSEEAPVDDAPKRAPRRKAVAAATKTEKPAAAKASAEEPKKPARRRAAAKPKSTEE
jgi:large subunit ribosomal protein L13